MEIWIYPQILPYRILFFSAWPSEERVNKIALFKRVPETTTYFWITTAIGTAEQLEPMSKVDAIDIEWAGSYMLTHPSSAPVYSLTNWYQAAMSGGTALDNQWARADIYTGKAAVHSFDPLDWVDIYTGGEKKHSILGRTNIVWATGANEWVPQNGFIEIIGPCMGYADANIGYSNIDGQIASGQRVYTYWYINPDLGIDEQKVIYW